MDNGGCDGQCTNRPGGYFCSCSTGFRLASNGKKCIGLFRSHFLSLGFPFVPVRVLSFNTMVLFSFLVNEGKSVSQRFSSCFQLQRFEAQLIKDNSATVFFLLKRQQRVLAAQRPRTLPGYMQKYVWFVRVQLLGHGRHSTGRRWPLVRGH